MTSTSKRAVALAFSIGLVAAACGSSGGSSSDSTAGSTATTEATGDTMVDDTMVDDTMVDDTMVDDTMVDDTMVDDTMVDDTSGGDFTAFLDIEPTAADDSMDPIVIGVQNLEGDPAGSFPEYSESIQAAANYVNAELGGLGGHPVEIQLCKSVVTPDDSQRCANELSASGVDLVISTINFFGNHYPIYQGAGIPVVIASPVTIADYTTVGAYAIGNGGGCLGAHTGLVQFSTSDLEDIAGIDVEKVAVPWADTPPGVVCYNDLEAKPLDVLNGTTPGDSARAGEKPDLTYIGVPIKPATPDVTPMATQIIDFDPDAIIFSAQPADCWNLVDALGRLGWTPDQTPLAMSGPCIDFDAAAAAGDLAKGIYFIGTQNGLLADLGTLQEGTQHFDNASTYQTKAPEYGMPEDDVQKGYGTNGFSAMINIWEQANQIDGEITGQGIADRFAATDGTQATFGGAPLDCKGAVTPYVAVCSATVSILQWNGSNLDVVVPSLNGTDLVAGTELRPG